VNVSIPQSVWWIRMISLVPSRRCEMVSDRARVADHVGLARPQPEDPVDVEAGVHAGHHRHLLCRRHRELLAEGLGVGSVVRQVLVGHAQRGLLSFRAPLRGVMQRF